MNKVFDLVSFSKVMVKDNDTFHMFVMTLDLWYDAHGVVLPDEAVYKKYKKSGVASDIILETKEHFVDENDLTPIDEFLKVMDMAFLEKLDKQDSVVVSGYHVVPLDNGLFIGGKDEEAIGYFSVIMGKSRYIGFRETVSIKENDLINNILRDDGVMDLALKQLSDAKNKKVFQA